uniref:C2H2-type domain-containing protein n=1 Tax=Cacopsylla melanoneura TaxID=428564 RepID=A0A8D8M9T1_9HEMI
MKQPRLDYGQLLVTLTISFLSQHLPICGHPVTEGGPGDRPPTRSSILMTRLSPRLLTIPDLNALTDPEEMILVHKNTIIQLTERSTKINKAAMKAMRSIWAYNMTSPKYRKTIVPHRVVLNETMTAKEHEDLQFLRWREPFLMSPAELHYYGDLRKKHNYHFPRKCPSCRQIVLDTYEQYQLHSFEYDERGYVRCVTAPPRERYDHACYMCPAEFIHFDDFARHLVTHSVQFAKYSNWTYPYTHPPMRARRKTTIEIWGPGEEDKIYFNKWPAEDESTDLPPWKRGW